MFTHNHNSGASKIADPTISDLEQLLATNTIDEAALAIPHPSANESAAKNFEIHADDTKEDINPGDQTTRIKLASSVKMVKLLEGIKIAKSEKLAILKIVEKQEKRAEKFKSEKKLASARIIEGNMYRKDLEQKNQKLQKKFKDCKAHLKGTIRNLHKKMKSMKSDFDQCWENRSRKLDETRKMIRKLESDRKKLQKQLEKSQQQHELTKREMLSAIGTRITSLQHSKLVEKIAEKQKFEHEQLLARHEILRKKFQNAERVIDTLWDWSLLAIRSKISQDEMRTMLQKMKNVGKMHTMLKKIELMKDGEIRKPILASIASALQNILRTGRHYCHS